MIEPTSNTWLSPEQLERWAERAGGRLAAAEGAGPAATLMLIEEIVRLRRALRSQGVMDRDVIYGSPPWVEQVLRA